MTGRSAQNANTTPPKNPTKEVDEFGRGFISLVLADQLDEAFEMLATEYNGQPLNKSNAGRATWTAALRKRPEFARLPDLFHSEVAVDEVRSYEQGRYLLRWQCGPLLHEPDGKREVELTLRFAPNGPDDWKIDQFEIVSHQP